MKKSAIFGSVVTALLLIFLLMSCGGKVNVVNDPHFDEEGVLLKDSTYEKTFAPVMPNSIKCYVEVSGSMNGFFRANRATDFKVDVWQVLSYYSSFIPSVSVLTNSGEKGAEYPIETFKTMMNTGAFVSTASTKVTTMLQSIIRDLNAEAGEVAMLISDMKYSPDGSKDKEVLLAEYSADISKILGEGQLAVSLVCATSNFLAKNGDVVTPVSPYYYLLIGKAEQVAALRNGVSTMLENNHHFVDNIESGFDFGRPSYSFGTPRWCFKMDNDTPTFVGLDVHEGDTCKIKLLLNLENYRWLVADTARLKEALKVETVYGSNVAVGDISLDVKNINDKKLERKATASVDLKLFDVAMDAEVIKWSLELPDLDVTYFTPFFGAADDSDATKSYSIDNFIKGMFYGGVVNTIINPNYILVSKNRP